MTRRELLNVMGAGFGMVGFRGVAGAEMSADPLLPKAPHFPAKAKRVIYLFMGGAPSHLELFDNKPQLAKFDGTLPPPELVKYSMPVIETSVVPE